MSAYRYVKRKHHPLAPASGRLPEHRVILYDRIGPGRHLCNWCDSGVDWAVGGTQVGALVADHIDGDPCNNASENLVPSCHTCNVRRARDRRFDGQPYVIEGGVRQAATLRLCGYCGEYFLIATKHLRDPKKGQYCSRSCARSRR